MVYNINMRTPVKVFLALGLILALAAFFRFWALDQTPPGLYPDEAMNGNNALWTLKSGDFKVFYGENNGREGLFMNLIALSIGFFGNNSWAIRLVSAIFGVGTVLGMFFLGRELFLKHSGEEPDLSGFKPHEAIALLAAFFLAVSFWHINFSRIGFRAIMAPFFAVWALYFLYLTFRQQLNSTKRAAAAVAGGLFLGLGAHSYIAYRLSPFLLAPPAIKFLKTKKNTALFVLFLFSALAVFSPLGIYFLKNPQDFLGRTSQISIFSDSEPFKAFAVNLGKTFSSLWFQGDYNPRHNLPGAPQLWWPVGVFFAAGLAASLRQRNMHFILLWLWLIIFSLPVAFSSEGLPHALRAILMLPAVMFFAAFGFWKILTYLENWFRNKVLKFPEKAGQIRRIKFEFTLLVAVFLAGHIIITYNDYFLRWANAPDTYFAFNANYAEIGRRLNREPQEIKKYLVVNVSGVLVGAPDDSSMRPLPMPTQTIMFLTDTWPVENQIKKNLYYILPEEIEQTECSDSCLMLALEPNPEINIKIKERKNRK